MRKPINTGGHLHPHLRPHRPRRRGGKVTAGLMAAGLIVALSAIPATAQDGRPFTAPSTALVGSGIVISGDGCPEGVVSAGIAVGYPESAGPSGSYIQHFFTTNFGEWSGTLTDPVLPKTPGLYSIYATCMGVAFSNSGDGIFTYAPKRLQLEARPVPVVSQGQIGPQSLDFASQPVGTAGQSQTVTLTNTGTTPLQVTDARLTGAAPGAYLLSSTPGCTAQPGQSCNFSVSFRPDHLGPEEATLVVHDDTPAGSSGRIIALRGTGVALTGTRSLTTSAPQGPAGTTLAVSGGGCTGGVVSVALIPGYPAPTGPSVAAVTANPDAQGGWSAAMTVPAMLAAGDYSVTAVCRAHSAVPAAWRPTTSVRLVATTTGDVLVAYTPMRYTVTATAVPQTPTQVVPPAQVRPRAQPQPPAQLHNLAVTGVAWVGGLALGILLLVAGAMLLSSPSETTKSLGTRTDWS